MSSLANIFFSMSSSGNGVGVGARVGAATLGGRANGAVDMEIAAFFLLLVVFMVTILAYYSGVDARRRDQRENMLSNYEGRHLKPGNYDAGDDRNLT